MSNTSNRNTGRELEWQESESGRRGEGAWKSSETTFWIDDVCGVAPLDTMSALSLNCRRLGNSLTVKTLQQFVKEEDSTLVFLMETKFKTTEMEGVKRKIKRQHGLVVPSQNRGVD